MFGISHPQTPPSHVEKQSGESSQIFGASTTSNVRNILHQNHSKKGMNTSKEIFGNRPKKFDWFLMGGACGLGTRLRELRSIGSQSASVPVENA